MKNIFLLTIVVFTFTTKLLAQNNPTRLYLDIANSISTARGNIDLYFTAGHWTKVISSKKVIILFSEGQRVNFKFAYSGGQLQDGSEMTFTPGIHIWVKVGTGGLSLKLDKISWDDNGKFKDWSVSYDRTGTNDPNQIASIQSALRLNDKSESLFTAKLLKNFNDARKSDQNGNYIPNNKPFLTSLTIKKPNESEPGLAVSFIPNSTIHFSSRLNNGTFDNVVSMNTGNFEIRYLEYDLLNKSIDCEISQFNINLQNGVLQTSDMLLNISSGSNLKFSRLKIFHDNNSSEINGENGSFNMQVAGGTRISLSRNTNYRNELIFDNGELNLFDFGYQCSNDTKTIFRIGGGSTLSVASRSGSLSLCNDKGYLSIAQGRLEAIVSGTWNSQNSNPDSHLNISLFDVSLDGGYLPITNTNIVGIRSGHLKSESLRLDALTFSSLIGEIKDLNVILNDESRFIVPGGIQINIKEGSVINGAEPNHPLKLDINNKYISGLFKFNVNFSTLSNSSNELLKIYNGEAKFKVDVQGNETYYANDIYIKGTSNIQAQDAHFPCTIEFLDGKLASIKGQNPTFNSKFKFKIEQSKPIEIVTPYYKPDDRTRVFPVKTIFTLTEPANSQEANISFNGQNITLEELTVSPKFTLTIPEGKGEHKDENDPNSADGSKGPDWTKTCQEVAFYDCPNPVGVMHFYVFPETYKVSSTIKLSITDKIISFNFGSLAFDSNLKWEKDGCDLQAVIGVIGIAVGGLLGGPFGATVGAIVGIKVGGDLNDQIKGMINSGIARKTSEFNFNKQWAFK